MFRRTQRLGLASGIARYWRSHWTVAGLCGVLASCGVTHVDPPSPIDSAHALDADVFRAVVLDRQAYLQDIPPDGSGVLVLVDPRPMAIDEFRPPSAAAYHDDMEAVIAERLAVLAGVGIDTASALPIIPDCHPMMSAPPGHRVVHGCPPEFTNVVLVDTVRAGTDPGTRVLRTMDILYRPGVGREANVFDWVVGRRDDGAFGVLERRWLSLFER